MINFKNIWEYSFKSAGVLNVLIHEFVNILQSKFEVDVTFVWRRNKDY